MNKFFLLVPASERPVQCLVLLFPDVLLPSNAHIFRCIAAFSLVRAVVLFQQPVLLRCSSICRPNPFPTAVRSMDRKYASVLIGGMVQTRLAYPGFHPNGHLTIPNSPVDSFLHLQYFSSNPCLRSG